MKASENATITKARAIYGKRLKYSDYIELASKKRVTEAAEFLKKNTHFAKALSNIDTSAIHRGHLESVLNKAYFDMYEELCNFQKLGKQPFYNFLFIRSELRELLKALLYLNNDRKDAYIESVHPYMIKKSGIDLLALAKAENFRQLLNVLKPTPYYNVLKKIKTDDDGNVPYTKCEVLLRKYYMKWLRDTASETVDGDSKKALIDQINVHIDLINIINAYRMKKYFSADAETLKKYMLPFYGRLSEKKQNELFETQSAEEYIKMLMHTSYGRKAENISEDMESETFEREFSKIRYKMAKRALAFSQNAAVSIYSLMYLFEVELKNIINIIEGIRYNKSVSYIENLLITE